MSEIPDLTLSDLRDALKRRTVSSAEATRAYLDAIGAARELNAFVLETPEKAMAMAAASDARLSRGEGGPLEGRSARHQGPLRDRGHQDHGRLAHPR